MQISQSERSPGSYLYATSSKSGELTPATVFYEAANGDVAESLCRLFTREYGGCKNLRFHHAPAASVSREDQVLLDEAIDRLRLYIDPDPGVYDPRPSESEILRAQFSFRAEEWEQLLEERAVRSHDRGQPDVVDDLQAASASNADPVLTDQVLLQICRVSGDEPQVTERWMADLRSVPGLVGRDGPRQGLQLEHGITLLTSLLAELPRYNPTHLPFGYQGPQIQSHGWIDRDTLEQIGKQIVGLAWLKCNPTAIAAAVPRAVDEAMRLGFMEQRRYDAWRPGMPSGSGWRSAVTATPYGITKVRMGLESAASSAPTGVSETAPQASGTPAVDPTATEDDDSDAKPVRQFASALEGLRLATAELLEMSETADIYPESQVKAYYAALQDAEPRVAGISTHLADGPEKPGQIETKIRQALQKLARAMEQVASDHNDRPGAYPLAREITGPAWDALKALMPIELTLAITTMEPDELRMPAEDRLVSGLVLLMLLAQAYYKMLECAISMASWCSALDLELNESYIWVTGTLTNLLANHADLKDFPAKFEPVAPDLYPSTIRDWDWDDMVAPDAEKFLSTVQKYVHDKGIFDPEEGSGAWVFVEAFRPSIETAIERAEAYNRRMREFAQHALGPTPTQVDQAGDTRKATRTSSAAEQGPTAQQPGAGERTKATGFPRVVPDSENVAGLGVDAPKPPSGDGEPDPKQYRSRLFALCEARSLLAASPTAQQDRDVQQAAARLADELAAWVEAIGEAEADRPSSGGFWTVLGDDLRDMLGPAKLPTGVFEDDWTPLLTQLRMSGLSELAETLDRLAAEVVPQAQELARDMDAVAYLRNGGPRDAFYNHYAGDELGTYEAGVWQGRQDVARNVMKIVVMLRTLAEGNAVDSSAVTAARTRTPAPHPRRGTRVANIEKLEKELEKHLLAARDHAQSRVDRGLAPELLPRPEQKDLARRTGLKPPDVSRCLNDPRARVLQILWNAAGSLEEVMRYKRRS